MIYESIYDDLQEMDRKMAKLSIQICSLDRFKPKEQVSLILQMVSVN